MHSAYLVLLLFCESRLRVTARTVTVYNWISRGSFSSFTFFLLCRFIYSNNRLDTLASSSAVFRFARERFSRKPRRSFSRKLRAKFPTVLRYVGRPLSKVAVTSAKIAISREIKRKREREGGGERGEGEARKKRKESVNAIESRSTTMTRILEFPTRDCVFPRLHRASEISRAGYLVSRLHSTG